MSESIAPEPESVKDNFGYQAISLGFSMTK
jgi:hypothetical protein